MHSILKIIMRKTSFEVKSTNTQKISAENIIILIKWSWKWKETPCYLMSIFTLAWAENSVVERVQRITEVRLLKAVVVQNLQCV